MNNERLKELQKFSNDFNSRLEKAIDDYKSKQDEQSTQISLNKTKKPSPKSPSKQTKNKMFSGNLFSKKTPWKPPHVYNKYFEKFKKLENKYEINNWEILRTNHLIKRSYEKTRDLPQKKDMVPTNGVGTEFDVILKRNKSFAKLSSYGQSIIDKFVNDNKEKENFIKEQEEKIWEYRHSKPPVNINPWKPTNHVINEFSVPPADKIHSFRVEKKNKKFLVDEPYRISKKQGDYFYDRKLEGNRQLHF